MFVILDVRGFSYQTGWIIRIGLRDNFIKNNTLKRKRLQKTLPCFCGVARSAFTVQKYTKKFYRQVPSGVNLLLKLGFNG